jgi:hypothetical protein
MHHYVVAVSFFLSPVVCIIIFAPNASLALDKQDPSVWPPCRRWMQTCLHADTPAYMYTRADPSFATHPPKMMTTMTTQPWQLQRQCTCKYSNGVLLSNMPLAHWRLYELLRSESLSQKVRQKSVCPSVRPVELVSYESFSFLRV